MLSTIAKHPLVKKTVLGCMGFALLINVAGQAHAAEASVTPAEHPQVGIEAPAPETAALDMDAELDRIRADVDAERSHLFPEEPTYQQVKQQRQMNRFLSRAEQQIAVVKDETPENPQSFKEYVEEGHIPNSVKPNALEAEISRSPGASSFIPTAQLLNVIQGGQSTQSVGKWEMTKAFALIGVAQAFIIGEEFCEEKVVESLSPGVKHEKVQDMARLANAETLTGEIPLGESLAGGVGRDGIVIGGKFEDTELRAYVDHKGGHLRATTGKIIDLGEVSLTGGVEATGRFDGEQEITIGVKGIF